MKRKFKDIIMILIKSLKFWFTFDWSILVDMPIVISRVKQENNDWLFNVFVL